MEILKAQGQPGPDLAKLCVSENLPKSNVMGRACNPGPWEARELKTSLHSVKQFQNLRRNRGRK